MLVAENIQNEGYEIRVEVEPDFGDDNAIELIFTLAVRAKGGKFQRTTVDSGKIQAALKAEEDIVATAVIDQFGWFDSNFPTLGDKVGGAERKRTLPPGAKGRTPKTL